MTTAPALLAAQHQRLGFDCGNSELNQFLQSQAGQLARRGFGRTYVTLAEDACSVTGFVCIIAAQIETARLPAHLKLPRYPAPALRLGRLAVDKRQQGKGLGQQLVGFALQLALRYSDQFGLYAVLVDAKDDRARAFYDALGFKPSLDQSLSLYLPLSTLRKLRDVANRAHR